MPYAQIHYPFENKSVFDQGFPAEFIAEGLDQTRGWFYTLTVLAAALYDKPAFKNVIVNGLVMAEDGKKMSKSLKNYTPPDELMDKYGADALRLYLINSGLVKGEEQRFSNIGVKDMVRRALLPWYNSFKFFQTYASIDQWKTHEHLEFGDNITDKWILSNLQTLKKNISNEMEEYKLYNVVPALFNFIEDLTNWYIRLNRSRFWGEGLSQDKKQAYSTLYTAIKELSVAMAPFSPFLSEYIFQELKKFGMLKEVSVHHCTYPTQNEDFIDANLEDAVGRMQQIILLGRQKRNKTSIKVKTPLSQLTIIHKNKDLLREISKLERYIESELNVKKVVYSEEEDKFIKLYAKPNSPILGKRFGKEFGKFRQAISKMTASDLLNLEEAGEIEIMGEKLSPSDILIFREAKEGSEALSNRFISIELDCNLTDDLIAEGLAREVVNRIQKSRKELGLNVSDRIQITYNGDDKISHIIQVHKAYISKETLAVSLEHGILNRPNQLEYTIDSMDISLSIDKV
jgi:isoleucyl-tRNA synthetase